MEEREKHAAFLSFETVSLCARRRMSQRQRRAQDCPP